MHQAVQLKWNPVVLYMSLLVHISPRVLRIVDLLGEWISPCSSILQIAVLQILGPELCFTTCCNTCTPRFPVQVGQQVDDINHHIQGTFFQALHWSVEATCMLVRGLTSFCLNDLPATSRWSLRHTLSCHALFGANCWSKEFPLLEQTLCVM